MRHKIFFGDSLSRKVTLVQSALPVGKRKEIKRIHLYLALMCENMRLLPIMPCNQKVGLIALLINKLRIKRD